jgi:hypothetical protein
VATINDVRSGNMSAHRVERRKTFARRVNWCSVVPCFSHFCQADCFAILQARLRKLFCSSQDLDESEMSLHSLWCHLNRSAGFRPCVVQTSVRRKDLRFDRVARCGELR